MVWSTRSIRAVVDVGLTIPGLMILIILAIAFAGHMTVAGMALIVGVIAWLRPARIIRSQVLTMKQRPYVEMARLSGESGPEIIFLELMPNLLPFLAAALVAAVSAAILASIGLEALGLGPIDSPTLGMTIYWAILDGAVHQPLVVVVAAAHCRDLDSLSGPLFALHGSGRDRQSACKDSSMSDVVLQVRDLLVQYYTSRGALNAVNHVSFDLHKGETLGLVGESGSGKTTLAMALVGMIREPGKIAGGEIWLDGRDLAKISQHEYQQIRLSEISLMPQGAMNSLNPVTRIREQILDGIRDHGVLMTDAEADEHIANLLGHVGLLPEVADMYAHELSGGMKQRVVMAIAISLEPKVIIGDEPTSALDVVVQKRVMETLKEYRKSWMPRSSLSATTWV